ncbi:MAG: hypothetical protein ACRELF_12890, partial [Gemmataceae bacterium]
MIALPDVGHNRGVAAIETESFAENAAASRFDHGDIDPAITQQCASAARTAAIAVDDAAVADIQAIGAGKADETPRSPADEQSSA